MALSSTVRRAYSVLMDSATEHPDPAFPQLHPRPPQGWIGGPCGLSYLYGRYHVFAQHNPDSVRRERISWAHLSSPDLLRWRQESLALRPQPHGPDAVGCGPGVVIDDDGVPTAAYTGARRGRARTLSRPGLRPVAGRRRES